MVTGYAIRAAYALGLHIRNEDITLLPVVKEARLRSWWALWLLERQLVTLNGRPTGIIDSMCSIPRPSEGVFTKSTTTIDLKPATDHYLDLRFDLAKLTQRTIDLLYSPSVVAKTWISVQVNMKTLEDDLQQWRYRVPAAYDFSNSRSRDNKFTRATQTLGLYYYMSRILIFRTCLCGFNRQMKLTKDTSEFNRLRAEYCVAAAGHAVDLLPDSFDAVNLYKNGPWYNQVSLIMQACAIIMLEMSLRASLSSSIQYLTSKIEKLVGWLHEMAKHNAAAYRAWKQCTNSLASLAPRISMDMSNINMNSPQVNAKSEGRQHSVYPSIYGIDRPRDVLDSENQASSAIPDTMETHSQGLESQPWQAPFHSDIPLFDPSIDFEEPWQEHDFFTFDSTLMNFLDSSAVTAAGPPETGLDTQWTTMPTSTFDNQPSTTASGTHDTIMGYFGGAELSGQEE
jgi:hypothetical protein